MKVKSSGLFGGEVWERVYLVIDANSNLCYYKSKKDFKDSPDKMLKNRATDLEGYTLAIESEAAPYILRLVPPAAPGGPGSVSKAGVELKVDHVGELAMWADLLGEAIGAADARAKALQKR